MLLEIIGAPPTKEAQTPAGSKTSIPALNSAASLALPVWKDQKPLSTVTSNMLNVNRI